MTDHHYLAAAFLFAAMGLGHYLPLMPRHTDRRGLTWRVMVNYCWGVGFTLTALYYVQRNTGLALWQPFAAFAVSGAAVGLWYAVDWLVRIVTEWREMRQREELTK